jgi:hypothetical protein
MSENAGASTSRNPKGLHGLYRDNFKLYLTLHSIHHDGESLENGCVGWIDYKDKKLIKTDRKW